VSERSSDKVRELRARLDGLTIRDAARLGRSLKNLRHPTPDAVQKLAEQFTAAEALVATRTAALPVIARMRRGICSLQPEGLSGRLRRTAHGRSWPATDWL